MESSPKGKKIDVAFILFLIVLVAHLFLIVKGLGNAISDQHEFRQTQTALTSYYFIHNGYSINYITPVLGSPWTVPFEFPLYQFITSGFCQISGLPLEVSGRLISILFFYSSVWVSFLLMRTLKLTKTQAYLVLSVILVNPLLLFWSRTFMIESTALFFSLLFLLYFIKSIQAYNETQRNYLAYTLLALLFGVMGGLVKVTTFAVFFMVAGLFLLDKLWQMKLMRKQGWLKPGIYSSILFIVPIIATYLWTKHADAMKSLNYFGNQLTSSALKDWNYGTLQQKLSPEVWRFIVAFSGYGYLLTILMLILSYVFKLQYRLYILIFTIPYLLAPIIFTNLYYIHDYYSYGNTLLFSFCTALFAVSLQNVTLPASIFKIGLTTFSVLVIATSPYVYFRRYYPLQNENRTNMQRLGKEINQATSANDILLVRGTDWSSVIPYYSERRSICLFTRLTEKDSIRNTYPDADTILNKFNDKIDKYVVVAHTLTDYDKKVIAYYHLNSYPKTIAVDTVNCFIFSH